MKGNRVITASLAIIVIFIIGVVLKLAKPVLFPFSLAVFLSFVLSPVLNLLNRLKVPKVMSIVLILLLTFFLIFLFGNLFYSSGKQLASEFPGYAEKIISILDNFQNRLELSRFNWQRIDWEQQLNLNRVGSLILSSIGPFFSFFSNLFLVLFFLVFILAGRGRIKQKVSSSLEDRRSKKVIQIIDNIDGQIQKYLAIKTLVSLITGVLATAVFLSFGLDFAIVFGILTFLLNYIPNIGSFIATIFPVGIAFFQFESGWNALFILIILVFLQMSLGNLLEPRLMGAGLGLSPLVILFSLFFWGWLWGIPGMLLAVPLLAIIKIICSNIPSLEFVAVMMSK